MKKTEKRHWVNGYQVRGGWHKTLSLSSFNYAVMFSWGRGLVVELYKLVGDNIKNQLEEKVRQCSKCKKETQKAGHLRMCIDCWVTSNMTKNSKI